MYAAVRHVCAAMLLALLGLGSAGLAIADDRRRVVIVLDSSAANDDIHDAILNGIRERMSADRSVRLVVEHLDMRAHRDETHAENLQQLLQHKYAARPTDVLIAIDKPAMRFALRSRASVFGDAPLVVGEVRGLSVEELAGIPNATGVIGHHDMETNLELILDQNPTLKRIVIIDDAAESVEAARRELQAIAPRIRHRVALELLPHLPVAALERELAGLGPNDAVLLLNYARDASNRDIDRLTVIGQLERASNAPIYGVFEETVGYGIVGGYLRSAHLLGRHLAELTLTILAGKHADHLPEVAHAPHRYVFDFRQLERFGYTLSDLPADSHVIEEPDTFYYRYRHYFWLAVAVFAGMAFYIFQLLLSIQKRKRVQRGLERIIEAGGHALSQDSTDSLIADIVARLRTIVPSLEPLSGHRLATAGAVAVPFAAPTAAPPPPLLLDNALKLQRSQYRGRDALIYLPTSHLPLSLLGLRAGRGLDDIDQRLLDIAARNIAIEYENAEASRLAETLRTAREIQMAMLPRDCASLGQPYGLDVDATLRAATEVGGDLYDVFALDDDRLCVLVGDVSGKGVPAALFMAMTKTVIRASAETLDAPGAILAKANAVIERDNRHDMFVTAVLAIYDRRTGELRCASAGHPHPWRCDAATGCEAVKLPGGLALGILPAMTYPETAIAMPPGTGLLLYSDGVTEAADPDRRMLGDDGLRAALSCVEGAAAEDVVDKVMRSVDAFAASAPQADDITVLCVRRAT